MSGIQPVFGQKRYVPTSKKPTDIPFGASPTNVYASYQGEKREKFSEGDMANVNGGLLVTFIVIFLVAWVVLGTIAIIMSLICFGSSGSVIDKVLGLIIAWIFGPLYFIYYALNGGYCT